MDLKRHVSQFSDGDLIVDLIPILEHNRNKGVFIVDTNLVGRGVCRSGSGKEWEVDYDLGAPDETWVPNVHGSIRGLDDPGRGIVNPVGNLGETATIQMKDGRNINVIFLGKGGEVQVTGTFY
jgi:hypothetical protein